MGCGQQIDDEAKFCKYCGWQVTETQPTEPKSQEPSAIYEEETPFTSDEEERPLDEKWGWRDYVAAFFALTGMIFLGLASAPIVYKEFQPGFFDIVIFIVVAFGCFVMVAIVWKEPGEKSSEDETPTSLTYEIPVTTSEEPTSTAHEPETTLPTDTPSPSPEPVESASQEPVFTAPKIEPSTPPIQVAQSQFAPAQPQSPIQQTYPCLTCGQPLAYVSEYQRWYCNTCRRYV